ncbi:hypothetical protein VSX61_13335 [Brenneria populi subsp. brevivirga]|uniref:hypothetical protein n=1 Tax=Brenneria populi TaxID=1505588 RepID=UPI002E178CDA|nr:hypothetical protein [Brenneria populi subsp. brevivirga]
MINEKLRCLCCTILFVSLDCSASDNWKERHAQMPCGNAVVNVSADCKNDPDDSTLNICKSYQVSLISDGNTNTYALPYLPKDQRNFLKKSGVVFPDVVGAGDWVPQTVSCIEDKYILVGYVTGITEDDEGNNSLSLAANAPFFNAGGEFIQGDKVKELRTIIRKKGTGDLFVNFIEKH